MELYQEGGSEPLNLQEGWKLSERDSHHELSTTTYVAEKFYQTLKSQWSG